MLDLSVPPFQIYVALKPLLLVGSGVKYQGALVSERKRESRGERKHSGTFTTVLQISLPGPVAEV